MKIEKPAKEKKERRSGKDRRQSTVFYEYPERRSGKDRRKNIEEQLNFLIEQSIKKQALEKRKKSTPGSGKVIRRRKGEDDKRI
jgi:carbonic anhydrase